MKGKFHAEGEDKFRGEEVSRGVMRGEFEDISGGEGVVAGAFEGKRCNWSETWIQYNVNRKAYKSIYADT